jgi:hypothetical protein
VANGAQQQLKQHQQQEFNRLWGSRHHVTQNAHVAVHNFNPQTLVAAHTVLHKPNNATRQQPRYWELC